MVQSAYLLNPSIIANVISYRALPDKADIGRVQDTTMKNFFEQVSKFQVINYYEKARGININPSERMPWDGT